MSKDLSEFLRQWKYTPDDLTVRIIQGDDGREKVQLRVDLGVLQMELDGRPDGQRPEGLDSWLEYYERKQQAHEAEDPDGAPFRLEEQDCLRLWQEAIQYYHRYLSFWHLDRYENCARDTRRNLRLLAFVRAYGPGERHKFQFDQWRPYLLMMHARSIATPLIEMREFEKGLSAVDAGIDGIRDFLDEYEHADRAEECVELQSLEDWRKEILAMAEETLAARPETAAIVLRRKLDEAVAAEEFEEAARLRDEIRKLPGSTRT